MIGPHDYSERDYEDAVLKAASALLTDLGPTWESPIVTEVVRLEGRFPETTLRVQFCERDRPAQTYLWEAGVWEWQGTGLDWALRQNPSHLADMLVTNLQEIVDSDRWDDFRVEEPGEAVWVSPRRE